MDKEISELIVGLTKATAQYEIACHENAYHLNHDCTPIKECKLMEEAERRLMDHSS